MNQPTATPRTDAALYPMNRVDIVWPDFARTLERELAAAKAECERLTANQRQPAEDIFVSHLCDELARLRAELAVAENWVEHHSQHADDLIGENVRLRALFPAILAALRNGGGCTTDVGVEFLECVPNEVASVVSRLRAEVERLTKACDKFSNSEISQGDWKARAEKAEAELADWSVLKGWGGTPEIIHEFIKGQQHRIHYCQNIEAELDSEQTRLDYLGLHMGTRMVAEALNCDYSKCFPIRDAIDLAMKNESNTP